MLTPPPQVYHHLKGVIKKKYGQDACNVGDEGGFAPNIQENAEGLSLLVEAIAKAGYTGKIKIGMDVAASEFYKDGKYDLDFKNPDSKLGITSDELIEVYKGFVKDYPVITIEDPFDQDDWAAYTKSVPPSPSLLLCLTLQHCNACFRSQCPLPGTHTHTPPAETPIPASCLHTALILLAPLLRLNRFTAAMGDYQIVGDDLLVTNPARIDMAIEKKACTGLLLKVRSLHQHSPRRTHPPPRQLPGLLSSVSALV